MGKRGPKPKPAALHKQDGTYRPDRHASGEALVGDPVDYLPAPPYLPEGAAAAWAEVVAAIGGSGMLQTADALALEALALSVHTMREAQAAIDQDGLTVAGRFGNDVAHPLLAVRDKAAGEVRAWAARFGMTPSDRTSLGLQVIRGKQAAHEAWADLPDNPRGVADMGDEDTAAT